MILSFHSGWGGGILRLFLLLLGSQCPKPDTWQGSLYLWGLLWSSTANKGYQRVHAAPFPPGHIPQQESGRVMEQWEPVSHEVRPDGVSPAGGNWNKLLVPSLALYDLDFLFYFLKSTFILTK